MAVPYLTPTQLRDVLNPTGDPDDPTSASGMTDDKLAEVIAQAQAEVDGKLATRFTTPLASPPQIVLDVTGDIAAWRATLVSRQGDPLSPTDPMSLRYQAAEQLLSGIATGSIPLPGQPPIADPAGTAELANPYSGNLFTPQDVWTPDLRFDWAGVSSPFDPFYNPATTYPAD